MVQRRGRVWFIAVATAILGGAFTLLGATDTRPVATDLARAAPFPCVPATNVYVIVYNWKTSVGATTYQHRKEATNILLSEAATRKPRTVFGAGKGAASFSPFLAPQLLTPANRRTLNLLVEQAMFSGDQPPATDSVDYNPVFAAAAAADPTASARVFIAHTGGREGPYPSLHTPGPPTYVIGFGKRNASAPVLKQIAADTGGGFYPVEDRRELLPQVAERINERLSCLRTRAFVDTFRDQGQVRPHGAGIARGTKSVDVTLTWEEPGYRIKPTRFVLMRRGRPLAIKTTRGSGSTFATARISGRALRGGGRLRFQVKARRLPATENVTTVVGSKGSAAVASGAGPLRPSSARRSATVPYHRRHGHD